MRYVHFKRNSYLFITRCTWEYIGSETYCDSLIINADANRMYPPYLSGKQNEPKN